MNFLGSQADELREDVELLEGAANPFDLEEYLKGSQTPVFFGSAINNFGVRELLDAFVEMAPCPGAAANRLHGMVSPYEEAFSGFVFKIQANMDPAHRDRIAFFRICSGKFSAGMKVRHHRIGKDMLIANADHFHGPGPQPMWRRPTRAISSASTIMARSRSATRLRRKNRSNSPAFPISPRSISAGCG